MKGILAIVNSLGLVMLPLMTDIKVSARWLVAAALALNLALLVGRSALAARPARWGAIASIAGYCGVVGGWLVLAFGCGIEYFNASCDAIVTPIIAAAFVVSLAALPAGRLAGAFVRTAPSAPPARPGDRPPR